MSNQEISARPVDLVLGGDSYQLSPLTFNDWVDFELWAQKRFLAAAASLMETLPKEMQTEYLLAAQKAAARMTFDSDAVQDYLITIEGMTQILYLGLKKNHPEITTDIIFDRLQDPRTVSAAFKQFAQLNGMKKEEVNSIKKKFQELVGLR